MLKDSMKNKYKDSNIKKAWTQVMKKGNLWALAVGILVGAAFGALVNSLANDLIMQAIAKAFKYKGVNYMSAGTTIWESVKVVDADGVTSFIRGLPKNGIMYGKFLGALLSFVIIVIFLVLTTWLVIVIMSKMKNKNEVVAPEPTKPTTDELILDELIKLNAKKTTKK